MADLAVEQVSQMASHDAAPEFAQNVFLVVWRDEGDDDPLMVVHRRGKCCQGRKIGRKLEDSADLSTSDCLEFYGPGSKQARPGATDAGGTTKPGLWCITAVFRQWDDGENIEQAISLTRGGPAPKWRRMDRVELAAFARGGVSKKIEAWLLGPTQALWDGSPVVPCETAHVAAPETPRLDYSKPPPGYTVRFEDSSGANGDGPPLWWYGAPHYLASMGSEAEALAAAWAHYKAHNDPPGMWSGQARGEHPGGYGYALMESSHEHPLEADFERIDDARAAAWAWYDRRLALHGKASNDQRHRIDFCGSCGAENEPQEDDECPECSATSCLISTWGEQQAERYRTGERYTANDPDIDDASPTWPRCLTWSDEQVAEVERWLADSTAEMPEVLRG